MRYPAASFFLLFFIITNVTHGQTNKRIMPATATQNGPVRICVGLPLPSGYTIVAYEKTSACPQGAYVLRKDSAAATNSNRKNDAEASAIATTGPIIKTASRPRKVGTEPGNA